MSEATPEETAQAPEPTTAQESSTSEAPPWGDDFNAEVAWERLRKAQRENKELRVRPTMTREQQKQLEEYNRLVEASKSEAERQAEALEAASRERDAASIDARRYRVAVEHGLSKDDIDLLGAGDEEQMTRIAARITELKSAAQQAAPAPMPGQRPVEQLRAGASPTAAVSEDDAILAKLFGSPQPQQ